VNETLSGITEILPNISWLIGSKLTHFLSDIRDKSQEHFVSITLNGANEVI